MSAYLVARYHFTDGYNAAQRIVDRVTGKTTLQARKMSCVVLRNNLEGQDRKALLEQTRSKLNLRKN
jgi:hypothetical protein